jgi:hypothetical protein
VHVAHRLFVKSFTATIDGAAAPIGDVFGGWSRHDRFGLVVDAPLEARGEPATAVGDRALLRRGPDAPR